MTNEDMTTIRDVINIVCDTRSLLRAAKIACEALERATGGILAKLMDVIDEQMMAASEILYTSLDRDPPVEGGRDYA